MGVKSFFNDQDLREILRKGSEALLFRFSGILLSYAFTTLVTRKHGVEAWGIVSLAYAIVQIVSRFSRLGLDRATLKWISQLNESEKPKELISRVYGRSLKIVLIASLLLSTVLALLLQYKVISGLASTFYELGWVVALAVPVFSLLYLNIWSLRALKRIKEYALLENTTIFLAAMLLLMFYPSSGISGSNWALLSFLSGIGVSCVLSFVLWARYGGISLKPVQPAEGLKSVFTTSFPMLFTSSLYLLMGQIDTLMIAAYMGEKQVGIYNIFVRVVRFLSLPASGVESIFLPKISKFKVKENWKGLERMALKSNLLVVVTTVAMILALLMAKGFILTLFGDDSVLLFSSISALYFLIAARFVNNATGNAPFILNMTGRQIVLTKIAFVSTLTNLALNAFLIPRWGLTGAAVASLVSVLLFNTGAVYDVKRTYNIKSSIVQLLGK